LLIPVPQIRAIRFDDKDFVEANLQLAAVGVSKEECSSGPWASLIRTSSPKVDITSMMRPDTSMLNEEVFLNQLLSRSQLLNRAFQSKILSIVREHACKVIRLYCLIPVAL
jgi:hypothetical protein